MSMPGTSWPGGLRESFTLASIVCAHRCYPGGRIHGFTSRPAYRGTGLPHRSTNRRD